MDVKSGLEIVRLHKEYKEKITELQESIHKLTGYGYTQGVLEEELRSVKEDLQLLEDTRFRALDMVVIGPSMLGGTNKYGKEYDI